MKQHTIITIGREYGSGGRLIAQEIAEKLSIPFYDKKLIKMAAKETGLSEEFISETEERRTTSFLYNLYFNSKNLPLSDQVFIAESKIIKRIASEGSCVITGRCADYVLRDDPNCISVFIHAPLEERMKRAKEVYGVAKDDIQAYVQKQDKARAAYYNHFTTWRWGKCQNYDLSINSGLGEETVIRVVVDIFKDREAKNECRGSNADRK